MAQKTVTDEELKMMMARLVREADERENRNRIDYLFDKINNNKERNMRA